RGHGRLARPDERFGGAVRTEHARRIAGPVCHLLLPAEPPLRCGDGAAPGAGRQAARGGATVSWVERLNDGASAWGEALLRASWQGAALALIAWIVCRLWKRMPVGVHCTIWLVVCLKMLVGLFPVALALPLLPTEKPVALALPEAGIGATFGS